MFKTCIGVVQGDEFTYGGSNFVKKFFLPPMSKDVDVGRKEFALQWKILVLLVLHD